MTLQEIITLTKSKVDEAGDACPSEIKEALDDLITAALLDDKTSLGNAQALNLAASSFGAGGSNPDVVIFGDLNHFHNFNKQYGQEIGDLAIISVGKLIKDTLVDTCQAHPFRTHGDEFVILMHSSRLEEFKARLSSFASCAVPVHEGLQQESIQTSMSFGYAISRGEVGFGDLQARAEIACRAAKFLGNGACVEWTEGTEEIDSIRGRCVTCQAEITGYVPKRMLQDRKEPLRCPCCSDLLTQS